MTIDKATFRHNLRLTQAYCARQLQHTEKNTAAILRSINPLHQGEPVLHFKLEMYGYQKGHYFSANWRTDPNEEATGCSFAELFQQQLLIKHEACPNSTDEAFDGEILLAEFEVSVTDGAPLDASGGLIDIYDCAPIDTWFYEVTTSYGRAFLCWIPRPLVDAADIAVEVCCVDNIKWFKDYAPLEYQRLMAE